MENMTIGQRVRVLRQKRKLTQRGLAIKSGLDNSAISRIETDQRRPNQDTLIVLAKTLGVSTDFILTGKEQKDDIIDDFAFALWDKTKDLTETQKKDILNIVEIIKRKE
jgi:transcriptional regulator with XRE-family HTH domain